MCGKSLTVPEKKTNFSVGAWRTDKMTHNTDTFSGLDSWVFCDRFVGTLNTHYSKVVGGNYNEKDRNTYSCTFNGFVPRRLRREDRTDRK